jgi:hypothetical protein
MNIPKEPNYIYFGESGWIAQGNATSDTFRSGLVQIKQDFICRKDTADYGFFKEGDSFLEEIGTEVKAYIFPTPSYEDLGNGFVKCSVTAYGNSGGGWRTDLVRRLGDYRMILIYAEDATLKKLEKTEQRIFDVAIYSRVVLRGSIVPPPNAPKLLIYNTGMGELPVGGTRREFYRLGRRVERYDVTSYGAYDEIIISVSADGFYTQDQTAT